MDAFFSRLGNVADVLSLATLVFSALTFFKVQSEARKLRQSLKQIPPPDDLKQCIQLCQGINSPRPVALILSLTPHTGSIKPVVEDFLRANQWNMGIEEVNFDGISPHNLELFYQEVRNKKRELDLKAYTEIHLFLSGPVQAGTILGCLLSNWKPVKLYHKVQGGSYEYWMPLIKI
jgi:hypothetical protein